MRGLKSKLNFGDLCNRLVLNSIIFFVLISNLTCQVLFPLAHGRPLKQSSVDRYKAGMITTLETLEQQWLKENKFISGGNISIADILAVCELQQTGEQYINCHHSNLLHSWSSLHL